MTQRRRRGPRNPSRPAGDKPPVPFDWLEAYVGFPASTSVTNALLDLQRRLERRRAEDDYEVRWVKATRMYVNIRPVGAVLPELLEPLEERLAERFADMRAVPTHVERLSIRPSDEQPMAIWAELGCAEGAMEAVRERLDEVLAEFGIEASEAAFEPHLTLGLLDRVGDVSVLQERLSSVPSNVSSGFRVSTLHLRVRPTRRDGSDFDTVLRVELPQPPAERRSEREVEAREEERPAVLPPNRESERPSVLPPNRESERPSVLPPNRESERPAVLPKEPVSGD